MGSSMCRSHTGVLRWFFVLTAIMPVSACTGGGSSVTSKVQGAVATDLELQCEELDAIRLRVFPAVTLESAAKMRATALEKDAAAVQAAPPGAARAQAVLDVLMEHRGRELQPDATLANASVGLLARCKATS